MPKTTKNSKTELGSGPDRASIVDTEMLEELLSHQKNHVQDDASRVLAETVLVPVAGSAAFAKTIHDMMATVFESFHQEGSDRSGSSAAEAILASQMAALHVNFNLIISRMQPERSKEELAALGKLANSTARTTAHLAEVMRKLSTGGSQTVRVEHVTVENGGQAIVGNVKR